MFFGKSKKIQELESQISELKNLVSPEVRESVELEDKLNKLNNEIKEKENELAAAKQNFQNEVSKMNVQKNSLSAELGTLKSQIIETDDEILYQLCGVYEPKFIFKNVDEYKQHLKSLRDVQKKMIKDESATTGNMNWTVDGNRSRGKKMVKDMQKLLLRAFNAECDTLVDNVKISNYDTYVKRMNKSCETISKLGVIMSISISPTYLDLKQQELALALDYQQKKQHEKEELREAKRRLREEAALQKEIEEARKKITKEKTHYEQALSNIHQRISTASGDDLSALIEKQNEIEAQLAKIETSLQEIDYREANQSAGYVYIASNIGAFGENVYKIGMTRRLEPMDRIYELGDTSVPFRFDVHAMIFSDDARSLEKALHTAFDSKKVNMINTRREFFRVTLDEIKAVVKANFDKTVEFTDFPEAEEFRLSQKLY